MQNDYEETQTTTKSHKDTKRLQSVAKTSMKRCKNDHKDTQNNYKE